MARSHRACANRLRPDAASGFSLVELLVTLVIVGLLISIAIPLFLGAIERSEDTATKATLRDGMVAAHVWYTDGETYEGFDAAAGEAVEPSITWTDGDPGLNAVSIASATEDAIQLVGWSGSDHYFCIRDNEASVAASSLTFGSGPTLDSVDEPDECDDPSW